MTDKQLLQGIKNEINSMSEKFVTNTIATDDINNNIIDLKEQLEKITTVLNDIKDLLNN